MINESEILEGISCWCSDESEFKIVFLREKCTFNVCCCVAHGFILTSEKVLPMDIDKIPINKVDP